MEAGKDVPDDVLQERINDLAPNKCCTLIYTVSSSFDFVLSSWQFIYYCVHNKHQMFSGNHY